MKNLGYYNGRCGEIESISIPMTDRVCYFGDGVYDATYSRNYKIFDLDKHIDRLFNSARMLEILMPMSKKALNALLNELVCKMDTPNNFVYFQVTRSSGIRSHTYDARVKGNLWINIFPKEINDIDKKVKLISMQDTRFFHCNIKTLNLIPSVMASQRAKEMGCDEAVFHRNGRVTECAHSNIHIIKNGAFITAPLDCLILPGITRENLIAECKKLGVPVVERAFYLEELMFADEVIISSAGSLCLQVESIDGIKVGEKNPEILHALKQNMLEKFLRKTK